MASSPGASCLSDPNFAVICAFLERFAKPCGITYPTFQELQEMLENVEEVPQELVDLHIKLLRKARKTVFLEKWEKALIKFCHTYSSQDGWELERFGYKKSRLEVKLRVLKMLLEGQFDLNSKFKASVNTLESEELRSKPLGKDKLGRVYWLQFDPTFNIRVYREDLDEESWTLVAQDRASLVILLQQLCENEYPLDLNLLNEDNFDLQEETLDTGQNNVSTLENVDHIEQNENSSKISQVEENQNDIPETEKLNINDTLTQPSNVENFNVNHIQTENFSKIDSSVKEESKSENILVNSEINGDKSLSVEKPCEVDDLGDVIEEPVMYITGEGCGEDCMTGNPEKEDKSKEESQKILTEKIETQKVEDTSHCSSENTPTPRLNLEKIKPTPKLWSIDTICGVNSKKEVEDKKINESIENFDVKVKQKNFSSFSIDSVLEKKDLIGLSESKPFSQFSVGSSNDTFPEHIQIKESDHSANINNSNINDSVQCNSNSSVINYKNSKVLPCVMISKTENLIGKSQGSKTMMNKMDSSFIVPAVDLRSESVEQNINSQTLGSSEIISNKCEQNSEEGKIFYKREAKTNVVSENKALLEKQVQPVERIPEKENKGDESNDLKDSEIMEQHDTSKNDLSNKNVLVSEVLNVMKHQKNYEDEFKKKEENFIDETESIKSKPFSPSLEVGKGSESLNLTEENIETNCKSEKEPMPISIENSDIENIECTLNEPYNFENRLQNLDYLQSKTSNSEVQSSIQNASLQTMAIIEKNFLKEPSDQVILQNKTTSEEIAKETEKKYKEEEEENIENISFKCKSQEGNETRVKSQLVVPDDHVEISSTIECNKNLLNLSVTQSFAEGKNDEKFQLPKEKKQMKLEPCTQLQANQKTLLIVNKCEENKKSEVNDSKKSEKDESEKSEKDDSEKSEKDDSKKLEEESKETKTQEKEILNRSSKSNENIYKFEVTPLAPKEEKRLEDELQFNKIVEDEIKAGQVLEEKQKQISDSKLKTKENENENENERLASIKAIKAEKVKTSFKSNENVLLSKVQELHDQLEAKQFDPKFSEGKKESPENEEAKQILKDFNYKEKKEEDTLNLSKTVDIELDEKQGETKNACEKLREAQELNEKLEEKLDIDLKLIKGNDDTSQIKIEESNSRKDKFLSRECNFRISKIELNEISESIKEEKHFIESDSKPSQLISKSQDVCAEDCETSNKKLPSHDLLSKKHIKEVSITLEFKGGEEQALKKDIKLDEVKKETPGKFALERNENTEKETIAKFAEKSNESTEEEIPAEVAEKSDENTEKGAAAEVAEKSDEVTEKGAAAKDTEKSDENTETIDESKEILHKSGRKRKKGSLPARIMSRNRKTATEETKEELDIAISNINKSEADLKINDEKLETSNEIHSETLEENVELENKAKIGSENEVSITDTNNTEIKKSEVTSIRRGRKPRGRKRRRNIAASGENKSTAEELVKDKPKFSEDDKETGSVKKKGRPKKDDDNNRTGGRQITSREIKLLGITNPDAELTSIRQSRRIAQIKMREEAERRRLEALQLESFKTKKKTSKTGKRKSRKNADSDSYDEKDGANEGDSEDEKSKPNKEKKSRKKKKKDKLVFNELNPWLSSSGSSSADEEEEEIEEEPHDDEELVFKSDHEFSPESDVEDPDYKPIKRARTAKVEESKEEAGKYDDTSCEKCGKNDHPEWILLCDKCDKGWHASCVRPALMVVPEGDWFCPPCEHSLLIMKLQESLKQFDRCQRQREIEEMRKKRLAFVGISLDNVLPLSKKGSKTQGEDNENEEKGSNMETESGSEAESSESESGSDDSSEPIYQLRERRSAVTSYRYNEYDELIKSALQDEIEAVKGAGNAGRGKDINNIVNAEKQKQEEETEEVEEKNESILSKTLKGDQESVIDVKPKEKIKKEADAYERDTDGDMVEEEEEDVVDEIPPVVPKDYSKKKKSKSLKITSLDFTSEEEDHNSDSDFKGASSEEESDYSLPSESESSDDRRKSRRNGPLRRSTRARTSRYDRDFINDESDDSPKRKKIKREWDSSESSDSDRSWGRKKLKGNRSAYKSVVKQSRKKGKKKKHKRKAFDSDKEESLTPARPRNKKIKFGGLDSLDEQPVLSTRTRGKKINYQEMNGSDSEDEVKNQKTRPSRVIESDDDFIAENEKDEEAQEEESEEIESEVDEDEEEESGNEEFSLKKETSIKSEKMKKKGIISDSDDSDKNDDKPRQDNMSKIVDSCEVENKEKQREVENIVESSNASNQDKFFAENERLTQSKEEKETADVSEKETTENKLQHIPSNTALSEYPGSAGKFPKIVKIKITPSRAELASHLAGMPSLNSTAEVKKPGFTENIGGKGPSESTVESEEFGNQSSIIKSTDAINPTTNFLLRTLQSSQKPNTVDSNIPSNLSFNNSIIQTTRSPMSYPANCPSGAPLNVIALLNSQNQGVPGVDSVPPIGTPLSTTNSRPQFSPFRGVISPPSTMSMFPSKIPTTVTGISEIESQNLSKKKGSKNKNKPETSSQSPENGSDIPAAKDVWPSQQGEFNKMQGVQDSPPKKKGRGRGKKQLLAEAQAQALARTQDKQELSQFLPQTLSAEGGSVISRILNTSQGSSFFTRCEPNQFLATTPRVRPPFGPNLPPNFSSPRPMPPIRQRPPTVGGTIFHTSHPLDPSPSGGGAINISIASSGLSKPSPPISSPFTRGAALPLVPPRFPPDPSVRPLFTSRNSPPRPEFSPFSHFYGNFPPPTTSLPSSENSNFSSSTFSESFGEDTQGSGSTANPKQFEDETGGEFGGLASYFASQREDDLET